MTTRPLPQTRQVRDVDRRDLAWYLDRTIYYLVFVGGFSAIVFIIGIFVFISREGLGFVPHFLAAHGCLCAVSIGRVNFWRWINLEVDAHAKQEWTEQ